jgi:hypothetical protein
LETTAGTLLRETLESERGRLVQERLEAVSRGASRAVDESLQMIANELATTSQLLAKRFENEDVFHIPREYKLIYPVKVHTGGSKLK